MTIFTTVADAINYVDDIAQDDQSRDGKSHTDVVRRVGIQLWDEGHIDGLRSGNDWSEWLEKIPLNAITDFIDGKSPQITND